MKANCLAIVSQDQTTTITDKMILLCTILFLFYLPADAIRCYQCEYRRCPALANCKDQRDICTINNFDRWDVRQIECPGPCETHLMTDPNGQVVRWHRGCSQQPLPPRGSSVNICETIYRIGVKEDICTCSGNLCNAATATMMTRTSIQVALTVTIFALIVRQNWC